MKKIHIFLLLVSLTLFSCRQSEIDRNPIVEQIELRASNCETKYAVKFKTTGDSKEAWLYTNFKHEVGDTLISYNEYFQTKLKPATDSLASNKQKIETLLKENDGLKTYVKFLEKKIIDEKLDKK